MPEDYKNAGRETGTAFALAAFLLSGLVFLVLCGSVWAAYMLTTKPDSLDIFLSKSGGI